LTANIGVFLHSEKFFIKKIAFRGYFLSKLLIFIERSIADTLDIAIPSAHNAVYAYLITTLTFIELVPVR